MLILGIDTGGTYTDGVIVDRDSREVLYTAKALTTYDDLSKGIENCIHALGFSQWEHLGMVSLSTTLATNAIVEGKGCRVGLIVLGRIPEGDIPADIVTRIDAQINIRGSIKQPLTVQAIDDALIPLKGLCDAVAISGYAGVRNPAHEQIVKQRVKNILGVPAVCGHEMTASLGYYERTVTAVLNARLLPLIQNLLDNVRSVMKTLQIQAPLMIVRGDGSLMNADYASERPVETVLSGPAASVTGALFLSGHNDGLVVDIGGTTTDIAALRDGECKISEEGANLSGWKTKVRALEISTFGLGGDSEIVVSCDGHIAVGPQRVVPLCRSDLVSGRYGLTPTDILHTSGIYRQWDAQKSLDGIQKIASRLGVSGKQLETMLYKAVLEKLKSYCREGLYMLEETHAVLIGTGAPAISWLNAAATQMKLPCCVPPHAEVANAIGAAVGKVTERSQAIVRRNKMNDSFYIYTEKERLEAVSLQVAQETARGAVCRIALEKARCAGAEDPKVKCKEELLTDAEESFMEWRITAKALGYPQGNRQEN